MRSIGVCIGVIALAIGSLPRAAMAVGFLDGTFDDGDWSTVKLLDTTAPGDATGVSTQVVAGGNPGALRQTTHDWRIANAGVSILFAHVTSGFAYDPAAGAIDHLAIGFDYRLPSPIQHVNTIAYGPLLVQGGSYYTLDGGIAVLIAPAPWTPFSFDGSNAGDWSRFGGAGQPDFSTAGAPISFGYYTSNGGSGAVRDLVAVGWIDNYAVTVTPEPASVAVLAVGGLAVAGRRQRAGMRKLLRI